MKTGTALDMDMTQLGGSLGELYRWWTDEISAMIPARLRRRPVQRIAGLCAIAENDGGFSVDGETFKAEPAKAKAATILLPPGRVLLNHVPLPPLRRADLRKLVTLDLDRLMPFPPGSACADVAADGAPRTDGRIDARIAALPRNQLIAIYASARDHGLAPRAIGVVSDSGDRLEFDFLPALVAEGIAPRPRGARGWWALVMLLFAANLGTMIWKDIYRTAALSDLVEAQQPLVAAARSLGQKLSSEDRTRAELIEARRSNNALATMAFVTRSLPAGAWVQRYNANAEMLRISGYKQPEVDVLGALRKSGAFASVRATTSDVAAESTTGQPFDITAEWAR